MPTSVQDIYKMSRELLGREPNAPENTANFLELTNLSRQEIAQRMKQETPAPPEQKAGFYRSLGWEPDRSMLLDDVTNFFADIVEATVQTEEDALADIGVFEFDENAIREQVMEEPGFKKYIEEKFNVLNREISEGKITTFEDFDYRKQQIADESAEQLKTISITEAQTDEELRDRLADIQGTTDFNLAQSRAKWQETIGVARETQLGRGRGFSGVMKEKMGLLREARERETGEIGRVGGVAVQTAERTAKYTGERAQAAREAIQQYGVRETGRAREGLVGGARRYGLTPEERARYGITEEEFAGDGWWEQERQAELERSRESLLMTEVEQRRREAREEFEMMQEQALRSGQTLQPQKYLGQATGGLPRPILTPGEGATGGLPRPGLTPPEMGTVMTARPPRPGLTPPEMGTVMTARPPWPGLKPVEGPFSEREKKAMGFGTQGATGRLPPRKRRYT